MRGKNSERDCNEIMKILLQYLPIYKSVPVPRADFESVGIKKINGYSANLSFILKITEKYLADAGCSRTVINEVLRSIFYL
jgi:hypothetical protein